MKPARWGFVGYAAFVLWFLSGVAYGRDWSSWAQVSLVFGSVVASGIVISRLEQSEPPDASRE